MAKLDLRPAGSWQVEQEEKGRQAYLRVHGPGPATRRCDECGAFACYARGDFGRNPPVDAPPLELFCETHAPESLKRPGDFLGCPRS